MGKSGFVEANGSLRELNVETTVLAATIGNVHTSKCGLLPIRNVSPLPSCKQRVSAAAKIRREVCPSCMRFPAETEKGIQGQSFSLATRQSAGVDLRPYSELR